MKKHKEELATENFGGGYVDRRKFDGELRERLTKVETIIEEHSRSGREWRDNVCGKIDEQKKQYGELHSDIHTRFHDVINAIAVVNNQLFTMKGDVSALSKEISDKPCMAHKEVHRGHGLAIKWLYGILGLFIASMLTGFIYLLKK